MRIRWTLPAAGDLTQICDYIQKHGSSATARRVALSIYEGVGLLSKFPGQGRTGRSPNTRELVLTGLPYLVVYAPTTSWKSSASCTARSSGHNFGIKPELADAGVSECAVTIRVYTDYGRPDCSRPVAFETRDFYGSRT